MHVSQLLLALVIMATSSLNLVELDEVVDSEDGDCGLGGKLQTLHLADERLEDTSFLVVHDRVFLVVESSPKPQTALLMEGRRC